MANYDSSQHIKLYNSQRWEIYATINDLFHNKKIPLILNNINRIIITNDLECYSPTIELSYIDYGFTLSKYFRPNGMVLELIMIQPKKDFEEKSFELSCKFILNDMKILDQSRDTISYNFIGTHINSIQLIKNINYANNKEQGKISPYQIIFNLLNLLNYPANNNYIDTTKKIDFISSQSMTVKDMINYCLHMGVSDYDPPTYFIHKLLDNTAMLINQKTDFNLLLNTYNMSLQIFTDKGVEESDMAFQANNLISNINTGRYYKYEMLIDTCI